MVGPFVLFDHFGPAPFAAGQGVHIPSHGHAHLATLTYFFSGASFHVDNIGNRVVIEAGAVAWMHAGSGIIHSEQTPDAWRTHGGVGHGIQAWVALPEELEMTPPRFQLARADEISEVVRGGATVRVLVGEMSGIRSPIETCSPVLFVEARTTDEAAEVPLEPASGARALFFVTGSGTVDESPIAGGTLVVLHDSDAPVLRLAAHSVALLFGGVSLGRRYMQGNFIASSEARLDAALLSLS
jgi:redox-sensitive bicupin YhaK (pirin superfamily)